MTGTRRPQPGGDSVARSEIAGRLDANLFVEAGAGSGKTHELVTRVVALVTTGTSELRSIAAITFTEKAAMELRDRIRSKLEACLAAESIEPGEPGRRERVRLALDQLDGAAIGTLHAFAERVLSEHPVEAGIPPRIEVRDEVTSGIEFERRWTTFFDAFLEDARYARTLPLLIAAGVPATALRSLAVTFGDNWDLVAERVDPDPPEPPDVRTLAEDALAELESVCRERGSCTLPDDDKLCIRLGEIDAYVSRLRQIPGDDEEAFLEALGSGSVRPPVFKTGNCGKASNWRCDIGSLRDRTREAGDALQDVRRHVASACANHVAAAFARFTLDTAGERRASGQLEFHDLLVLARALVRDPVRGPEVRDRLHDRYRHLLLDEFQDTDPIQIELAVRIAAADPLSAAAGSAPWDSVVVAPGALFVVGDPKQSIYRFRRADIATFTRARDRFADKSEVVELTTNFRTTRPVIAFVNTTFGELMAPPADGSAQSRPAFVPLHGVRPSPPLGPPVSVLGRSPHPSGTAADAVRAAEAAEVAAAVTTVVSQGWNVGDGDGGWRPARPGDITVLVPTRTSLPFLEETLNGAGIAYRTESSSLVYATRAVRDMLMVLRAADDPTDYLRIVSALRTPLLTCGDDDLFRFRVERRGKWNFTAPQPGSVPADDPVLRGLRYLRLLHEKSRWRAPSELLERLARDRRAFELGFAEGRPRDTWRRLRFVIDQARAWTDATGGSLRQYLQWVDSQTAEGTIVAEAILPETDDDAVRIMTIHAAKGLEFPVTIVSGNSAAPYARSSPAEAVFPPDGSVGYRFWGEVTTDEYAAWKPLDEQMGFDERLRLLYVAATRTRDHLIVSLHREDRAARPSAKSTNAELLANAIGRNVDDIPDAGDETAAPPELAPPVLPPPIPFEQWAEELSVAMGRASRPTTVAATACTDEGRPDGASDRGAFDRGEPPEGAAGRDPGLHKRPRDLDLPPWLKGRYGTSVGRAVHGVLQTIDLATGEGLDAAVAAQCEAEAVRDRVDDVRSLVRFALDAPSVRRAAAAPHWRELFVCAPVGGRLLEGYVDLLYRNEDGLVVVDYKTAATSDPRLLAGRVEEYRLQGGAYALALSEVTREHVAAVVFVFLTPAGPVEIALTDVPSTVARVRELVADGEEVVIA